MYIFNSIKTTIDKRKRVVIVSIVPIITFIVMTLSNINEVNYQTIILMFSNLAMLPTVCACTYYLSHTIKNKDYRRSLIIEFLLSYAIIFISGIYHLCDGCNVCYGELELLRELDFIASYTIVATYILHLTRINVIYKIMLHVCQITIFIFSIEQTSLYTYILYFYGIPGSVVVSKIFERVYKKKLIDFLKSFNLKYFVSGIVLFVIGLIFGPLQLQKIPFEYYWIYHSFGWHVPIMLSSYCILKSTVKFKKPATLPRPPSFSIDSNTSNISNISDNTENSGQTVDSLTTYVDIDEKRKNSIKK